jgi:hypothetical protein
LADAFFLYGHSIQKQHLVVILKKINEKEISMEVKSDDDMIPKEILTEIVHVFKKYEKK